MVESCPKSEVGKRDREGRDWLVEIFAKTNVSEGRRERGNWLVEGCPKVR